MTGAIGSLTIYLCAVDGVRSCLAIAKKLHVQRKTVAKVYMYSVGQAQIIIMLRKM